METKNINLNPYKIVWIEFRPVKGFVTKHDQKLFGSLLFEHKMKNLYKWFTSEKQARDYLYNDFSKLDKPYECRIFTDKQYSNALESEDYKIHFTAKQESEIVLINN